MEYGDESRDEMGDCEAEFAPLKIEKPPSEPDDMGHWVLEDGCWTYELTPIGRAIMAEQERVMFEEMAAAHEDCRN